jgi:adenylosuccinate synthase
MVTHTAVIGTQWGDEGKGKIVDHLSATHPVVMRYQGGPNAGHTVVIGQEKFALHHLPSGILRPKSSCIIGDGVIIDPAILVRELKKLTQKVGKKRAQLLISTKAHLIMPWHRLEDQILGGHIGTTGKGIGPTYTDATQRTGLRVADWLDETIFTARVNQLAGQKLWLLKHLVKELKLPSETIKKLELSKTLDPGTIIHDYVKFQKALINADAEFIEGSHFLWQKDLDNQAILFEGAQATLLDRLHGDYPFVTSSHPTTGGLYLGAGFRPRRLDIIGVVKAYSTRVGNGPFPTELNGKTGERLRQKGHEFGTTTGRPRRCGWLDLVVINYASRINGLDRLAVTKLDILSGFKTLKICIGYKVGEKTYQDYYQAITQKQPVDPLYVEFDGWDRDISKVRQFKALPTAARQYLEFIEEFTGLPISFIGIGPERSALITRKT